MPAILLIFIVGLLASGCSLLPKVYEYHDPLTPQEHLALGVSYESEGKADLAIGEYKKVIASEAPDHSVTARVFLGNVYAGLEQYDAAEQYYHEALSLDPHRGQALNNLAALYVKQGVLLNQAESLARTAVTQAESENQPSEKGIYLETLGEVLLHQGRFSEALENFRKAEAFNDRVKAFWLVQLYTNMADAYQGLGQTADAQQARQRADKLRESGASAGGS
jgi:tetratricopeptide (TPR) repeat protein